jgi:hypothetical protein
MLSMPRWLKPKEGLLFPLLAFIIPSIMRAIPEILMAPYVVGFDTMAHYVPTTLLWLRGSVDFGRFVATAPLFYAIVVSAVLSGGSLILVLKVLPPLLHGFLGLSIYAYAKSGLGWSIKKSAVTALLATVYFVALRISWDLLRNELALILFFTFLTLLDQDKPDSHSWKRYVLLSLAMMAVTLAHQLVAIIMFGVVAFTITLKMLRKERSKVASLIAISLPAGLLFLTGVFFSSAVPDFRLIFGFSNSDGWLSLFGFSSYQAMLTNEAGFFLYCYLPLLPFIIASLRRFGNFQMRSWVVLSLIALLIPMVSPSNLRWVMMLTYPLAFYVSETLSRVKAISWKHFGLTLHQVVVAYLVFDIALLSLGFILMPPENSFPYFSIGICNDYIYQMPSSMLQNTVSIADCNDTNNALQWLKSNMHADALLLVHRAFYGWALSTLNGTQVVLYEYENPGDTAKMVAQERPGQIYLIWWSSGQGWYGQSTMPSSFGEVYQSGRIAVYSYTPTNVT